MQAVDTFPPRDAFLPPGYAETSREAYESVLPILSEMEQGVYEFVLLHGDATMEEMEIGCRLRHQTCGPIALALRNRGLLVAARDGSDKIIKRKTSGGRGAIVYRAVAPADARPREDARVNKWEAAGREALTALQEGMPLLALARLQAVT